MSSVPSSASSSTPSSPWLFEIPTRTHNTTGYWGPSNAIHQFCEPHYDVTDYIAEFYNCVSSLIFTLCALYVLCSEPKLRSMKDEPYVFFAFVCLAIIGLGSAAFHGTMRYHMQLLDELPMVFYITCLMLGSATVRHPIYKPNSTVVVDYYYPHPWIPNEAVSKIWCALTLIMAATIISIYVVFKQYEIFLHGFTGMIVIQTAMIVAYDPPNFLKLKKSVNYDTSTSRSNKNSATGGAVGESRDVNIQTYCRNLSVVFIVVGRVFWELEHHMCSTIPYVYPFHVLWHFFSCASAYYSALSLYFLRHLPPSFTTSSSNSTNNSMVDYQSILDLNLWGLPLPSSTKKGKKLP